MFIRQRKRSRFATMVAALTDIAYILSAAYKIPMISDKICPRIFVAGERGKRCTAPSSERIGRNFQIEPELGASKADTTQVSPAGWLGREVNSNSIDDGLGSLTRASYQRPSETPSQRRCPREFCDIHADYEKKRHLHFRNSLKRKKSSPI